MVKKEMDKFEEEVLGPDILVPMPVLVNVDEVSVDGLNPNKMDTKQFVALQENIRKFGFINPVITNKDLVVADGEHRFLAAKELGMKQIPVIRLEVDEVDRRILRQVLNKLKGVHDKKLDYSEFMFLEDNNSLELMNKLLGEDSRASGQIIEAYEDKKVVEDNFEVEKVYGESKSSVKFGDIYVLGNHRLMCGDSTNESHVKLLMNGDKANIGYMDPPYNIGYHYDTYVDGRIDDSPGKVFNDEKSADEYFEFMSNIYRNTYDNTVDKAPLFLWTGYTFLQTVLNALGGLFRLHQVCVWVKENFVFSPGNMFHRSTENCLILYKDGKQPFLNKAYVSTEDNVLNDLNKEDFVDLLDLWYVHRDAIKDYVHSTQKPVKLAEKVLKATTLSGDSILELFGGSGSTLICCEQMGRICYVMELDPKYVDVIIKRWEAFSGKKAEKVA